jgi:predicted ATP-dependent endonuclease of OLD family
MAHIVSFKIEGLAGRQDPLELELNRDTNIFFGSNGGGKTSLLKILHSAMANETDILARVPFLSAEVRIYSQTWDKVFTRSIRKPGAAMPGRSKTDMTIHHEKQIGSDRVVVEDSAPREELNWACKPKVPEEASVTHWEHQYLSTSRLHVSEEPLALESDPAWRRRTWLTEDQLDTFFARSLETLWRQYSTEMLIAVRSCSRAGAGQHPEGSAFATER